MGAVVHGWQRRPSTWGTWFFSRGEAAFEVEFWDNGTVKEIYRLGNQVTTVDHAFYGGFKPLLAEMRLSGS